MPHAENERNGTMGEPTVNGEKVYSHFLEVSSSFAPLAVVNH